MRKLINKKNDAAAIGIGAMIVLIAMILVACVAASVLITTSNALQTQAMRTGTQTIREVSGGLKVYSIHGYVVGNSTAGYENVSCLAITVEARCGSVGIDLNNTYILLSDGDTKALVSYAYDTPDDYFNSSVRGDFFDAVEWANLGNDEFAVGVLQDYDSSLEGNPSNPTLNSGDKAILYVHAETTAVFSKQIEVRTEVFGQVIPEFGASGVIMFTTPKAYTTNIYKLQ